MNNPENSGIPRSLRQTSKERGLQKLLQPLNVLERM